MADAKVDIFMPLYISDYDRDTADLSFEEHGFYGAILRALWTRGGVLQANDKQKLSRLLRTDESTLARLWPSVERFFVFRDDGTFHQKRLTLELEKAKRHKEIAVERARKGGLAKASSTTQSTTQSATSSTATSRPQALLEVCSSPSPSPSQSRDLGVSGSNPPLGDPDQTRARVDGPHPEISPPNGEVTAWGLVKLFGLVRAEAFPAAMPWVAPTRSTEKAESVVTAANDDPAVCADILPTMRLLFAKAKAGEYEKSSDILGSSSFGFGAWCSKFTDLQEELHGVSAPEPKTARPGGPIYRRLA
ncbi:MAG: DUF1376 domain-containing protein [Phenylobacterium sp.]|uniref:DUF1376 domain-containing protein n=1 Tax=Phenylobacterium sp. TaxID=1871053 RepID=UPI0012104E9A|nr:DUF1376 domain-containing protein [Phenylobacterium sp.]TAL28978.1 MAG: DUF1376 domain-containing protein [Phenylobacterium sp.]